MNGIVNTERYYWEEVKFEIDVSKWKLVNFTELKSIPTDNPFEHKNIGGIIVNSIDGRSNITITLSDKKLPITDISWLDLKSIDDSGVILDRSSNANQYLSDKESLKFLCIRSNIDNTTECKFYTELLDYPEVDGFNTSDKLFIYKFAVKKFINTSIEIKLSDSTEVQNYDFKNELELVKAFLEINK